VSPARCPADRRSRRTRFRPAPGPQDDPSPRRPNPVPQLNLGPG
jgi:hypothetical protein